MSKSLRKDIIRTIKNTFGRFISLVAIVLIGVAFYVGVSASSPVMAYSVDKYDDETNLMDLQIYSNYGFDDADIEKISEVEGIDQVQGVYFVDVIGNSVDNSKVIRIHSFDNNDTSINQFVLVEGRLPEKDNECLAERGGDLQTGYQVGQTIKVTRPDDDLDDFIKTDEFVVVGLIDTPVYLNEEKETSTLSNRYIQTYLYVLNDTFNTDYYLSAIATIKDAKEYDSFSDKYFDYVEGIKNKVEDLAATQQDHRKEEVYNEANEKYEDGLQEYNDGLDEYNTKISDAEKEIKDAEAEIADGETQLNDGIQQLADEKVKVNEQLINGANQITDARNLIASKKGELEQKEQEYLAQKPTLLANLNLINNGITQIESNLPSLLQAQDGLNSLTMNDSTDVNDLIAVIPQLEPVVTMMNGFGLPTTNIGELKANINTATTIIQSLDTAVQALPGTITSIEDIKTALGNPILSLVIDGLISQDSSIVDRTTLLASISTTLTDLNNALIGIDAVCIPLNTPIATFSAAHPEFDPVLSVLVANGSTINDVNDFKNELDAYITSLQTQLDTLKQQKKQIEDGMASAESQIADGYKQIDAAYAQTIDAALQLDAGRVTANEEFEKAQKEIDENRQKLIDAKNELADGKQELEDAKIDGKQELEDAKADLDKAKEDIEGLEENEWTILDRKEHYASATYKDTVLQMKAIGDVFPVFFFLVAALVCLTTMTRMIDEQRGQIGILRALGYNNSSIASKYIIYALLATIIGGVLGTIFGLLLFPGVIYTAWRMMYILPDMQVKIPWDIILFANIAFIVVMSLTTYIACHESMKEVPSQLLRPKAPKNGKVTFIERIKPLWNRMSFTSKVTARNLIRYKKRFFMTVIGVAGCTGLLITGFGIRDSISSCVDVQFQEIYLYDGSITFEDDLKVSDVNKLIDNVIEDEDVNNATELALYAGKAYGPNGENEVVNTEVYKNSSDIKEVYNLRTRKNHTELTLNDDGIIISEKLSTLLNVKVGDILNIEGENGVRKDVIVNGICEMYIYNYVFMSDTYYQKTFGNELRQNTLYINAKDGVTETKSLQRRLVEMNGVKNISFYDVILNNFSEMIKGLNYIIIVIILSSASLAFVVLVNLTNVNIAERQREIATLKVLGFRRKEVNAYVYKENIILTFIGSLVGIFIGKALHIYIIKLVEMSYVMFGREVHLSSILISIALTLLFSVIVNMAMQKKLHSIQMVESLKSVE